jgi:preprotein translocase subunit SecE
MEKVKIYFQEAYDELMHKVTWPTWQELQESSVIVLVAAVIIAIVISLMDVAFKAGFEQLYKIMHG